jgi:hypothetical protein
LQLTEVEECSADESKNHAPGALRQPVNLVALDDASNQQAAEDQADEQEGVDADELNSAWRGTIAGGSAEESVREHH